MPPYHEEEKIQRLKRAMYSRKYADKLGDRERREMEEGKSSVPEDWAHEERVNAPTLTPLQMVMRPPAPSRARGILKWVLGAAFVFFLAAIAFFLYYLYFGGASAISARNIDIVITGPAQIAGGELTDLEITVTNRNREQLELADLVVAYPPGTRLNPGSCSEQTCRITLGTIAPGGSQVVKLPAVYAGGAGQHASVSAELEYRLAGSNAIFVASSEYAFVFSSSPITIAVVGNTETVSGQPMQMTVTVSSNADQPIADVLLSASVPFGFKLTSASPQPDSAGLWKLGTISPGETKTITINGVLSGETTDSRVFHFLAGTKAATSSAIDAQLADTSLTVGIARPFLAMTFSVNDAPSGKSVPVAPGDLVSVAINYQNNLSSEIDNAVVVAKLGGIAIDGTSVHSESGFYRSTDNSVLWDKTTTGGELAAVPAGASGKLTFSFLMPTSEQLKGIQDPVLNISVSAGGQRLGETGVPENLQSTAIQKLVVASDLTLTAQGLYFTDPFGASGPMPPKAENETTYAIAFTITNTTNSIKNAVVTAALPPYVRLVGNHYLPASEKVAFDSNTGLFTWKVGDIAPGAGLGAVPPRQVVIEIGFTPSTSQILTSPPLVQSIKLSGTDASTQAAVTKTAPDVTTNIVGDPGFSSINAKVVK